MHLIIENYNNINKLEMDIIENKINFIYGISGCGKSSVGKALSKEITEENIKIGKRLEDVKITTNPDLISKAYNKYYVENVLFERQSENVYNVIFANNDGLEKMKEDVLNLFKELNDKTTILNEFLSKVNNIVNIYKIRKEKSDEKMFPKTSLIGKLEKEIENSKYKKYSNKIKKDGIDYVEWIKDGLKFNYYSSNRCPFCLKKLSSHRKELLGELIEITPKNFEILVKETNILESIGINNVEFKKSNIGKLKKQLINKIKLASEIENLLDSINSFNYSNFKKFEKFKITKEFRCEFPEVSDSLDAINNNIIEVNKMVSRLSKATNKIINKNEQKINDYLFALGIPYVFKKSNYDTNNKIASYTLHHKEEDLGVDRVNSLSDGEKNLLALIFFVISSNEQLLIIDDPASSYDETRKGIIFNIICENLKNKTVLVLSHDQMFSKYASFEKENKRGSFKNTIGYIRIFENYTGDIEIKEINKEDFNRLESHILNFINNDMCYYRKIINLKLLSEVNKNNSKINRIIYSYISDIFHNKLSKSEIINKVSDSGYSEDELINKIISEYKLNINLDKIPDNIFKDFNVTSLSNYEKIIYEREKLTNKNKEKIIRCEYNNIVHLNNNYLSVLNPYKYNYFSPAIYEMIIKNKTDE